MSSKPETFELSTLKVGDTFVLPASLRSSHVQVVEIRDLGSTIPTMDGSVAVLRVRALSGPFRTLEAEFALSSETQVSVLSRTEKPRGWFSRNRDSLRSVLMFVAIVGSVALGFALGMNEDVGEAVKHVVEAIKNSSVLTDAAWLNSESVT